MRLIGYYPGSRTMFNSFVGGRYIVVMKYDSIVSPVIDHFPIKVMRRKQCKKLEYGMCSASLL